MGLRVALGVVAAIAVQASCLNTSARAQAGGIPCENFSKNADGSWTVLRTTFIEGPAVKVQEDATFKPGRMILGYDIAAMITKACPNAKIDLPSDETPNLAPGAAPRAGTNAAPSAASGATVSAQPTQSPLAKYADANGNIDIRQFTCGHFNEASAEEAQLLLAWYSGWYKGLAKSRGINLARVRYSSRAVIDYCKANRDKRLTEVMELMLK